MVRSANSATSSRSSLLIPVAVAIALLYFGRQILIPLALALVLGFLLTPVVALLGKLHLGRVPAVLIVLTLCLALTASMGWMVAGQLLEITSHIGDYKTNLEQKIKSLHSSQGRPLAQVTETVRELNKELPSMERGDPRPSNQSNGASRTLRPIPVQVTAPQTNLIEDLRTLVGPLASPLETVGMVIIFTAFILIKREDLRNRLIRLGGEGRLNVMTQALDDASRRLSRYLFLQFLVNSCYGILFGLGLYAIGVPHTLLWGAVGALLRFVPYIGSWIGAALPVAIAVAVFPGWAHAGMTFGLFLILELSIGNIIEPWLYGAHTGISSLAILVAAVFWATLWGPVGLILSTPLTVCLMLAGRYVPQLDFLEVMLGDEPVLPPAEHFYQRLLAMDQAETRNIAELYLKDHPLESLYESVLIPALRLAEEDRHRDALSDRTSRWIFQSATELLEELRGDSSEDSSETGKNVSPDPLLADTSVVCVPARDEADELVGMMLAHLLRRAGSRAAYLPIGAVDDMLAEVSRGEFRIVCVSALPPFAVGQARSLCKRLRAKFPELAIVVGLWQFSGGVPTAMERVGPACTDAVATSLCDALLQIRKLAQPAAVEEPAAASAR